MPRPNLGGLALLIALVPWTAGPAHGQSVLAMEARAGLSTPVRGFAADHSGGASFGLDLGYRTGPRSSIRLGFSQHRLDCSAPPVEGACGSGGGYVHTGWDVGSRVLVTTSAPRPWIGLSAIIARVEGDGLGSEGERGVSNLSAGFDLGAGLEIPLSGRVRATPAVRYGWLDTRFPDRYLLRMRWVVADLGMSVDF